MKKLFQTADVLQLSAQRHIKYSGAYQIGAISEQEFSCIIGHFSIHIIGKCVVHYLQEDGFFLSCDAIESIHLQRL